MTSYNKEREQRRRELKDQAIMEWLNSLTDAELVDRSQFFDIVPIRKSTRRKRYTGTGRKWTEEQRRMASEASRIRWEIMTPEEREIFNAKVRANLKPWTEERKKIQSEIMKKHYLEGSFDPRLHCKPVNQYTPEGRYIESFMSIREASFSLGKGEAGRKNISYACNHHIRAYGFLWRFNEGSTEDIPPFRRKNAKNSD